jgi:hypothetical protein
MSKNTDLSELINYVKGASTGQLVAPFYTSPTSFTGTIAGYLGFDSSGNILTASGGSQWITSGSNIYYNTGNVSIGTSTPDIYSNIGTGIGFTMLASATNTSANLNIIGNGSGFGGISLGNSTIRRAGIFALDGSSLAFYTNGSNSGTSVIERLRITPNGNLGLGTSTIINDGVSTLRTFTIYGSLTSLLSLTSGNSNGSSYLAYNSNFLLLKNDSSGSPAIAVVSGTQGVILNSAATSWSSYSDESTKTDLIPIVDGLNKVASLRALTGRYKTDEEGTSRAFLIAQDVQSVLPEAVIKSSQNDKLLLSYTDVIPLLVASIKELKIELDNLKANN